MKSITDDDLRDLRDNGFGGCTTICECMDISDLREELDRSDNLDDFVDALLRSEDIFWDRCHDARAAGGIEIDFKEHNDWQSKVKERVLVWLKDHKE